MVNGMITISMTQTGNTIWINNLNEIYGNLFFVLFAQF